MHDWDDDRIFQRACVGLADKGHEVTLIATDTPEKPHMGVNFVTIQRRKGLNRRILSSREAYLNALQVDADIYHFHDPDLLPWMYLFAKKGRRVIYDVHENYSERLQDVLKPIVRLSSLAVKVWRSFENTCAKSFNGIITTTKSMQELFRDVNKPILAVSNTPYLISLNDVDLPNQKAPFTIYTSGSHSNKRNCMQTVEALPEILKEFPEVRMIFVGRYLPNGYEQQLLTRSRELGVVEHLELHGMLPWKENFTRTATMEIGCVFYEDNLNNRVTVPNRLFEYMYARVAVIGENFPEVKRVVEGAECGVTVNSADPSSIAKGVIELLRDQKKLREKQLNGRRAVEEKYAFDHELDRMIEFYQLVIKAS